MYNDSAFENHVAPAQLQFSSVTLKYLYLSPRPSQTFHKPSLILLIVTNFQGLIFSKKFNDLQPSQIIWTVQL